MIKYKLNDVVYFHHGSKIGKCVIEEIINHQTQEKLIVKYVVRPYGLKDYITVDADQLHETFVDTKKYSQTMLNDSYDKALKGLSELTYEQFMEQIEKKKAEVEDNYLKSTANLNELDEQFFDDKEEELKKEESK
jgi:hypothetical protein